MILTHSIRYLNLMIIWIITLIANIFETTNFEQNQEIRIVHWETKHNFRIMSIKSHIFNTRNCVILIRFLSSLKPFSLFLSLTCSVKEEISKASFVLLISSVRLFTWNKIYQCVNQKGFLVQCTSSASIRSSYKKNFFGF